MAAARALPALARASGAAARVGGAAAKSGAITGIENGSRMAMTQMTYGALSHVGQRQQAQQQPTDDPNDPFKGY